MYLSGLKHTGGLEEDPQPECTELLAREGWAQLMTMARMCNNPPRLPCDLPREGGRATSGRTGFRFYFILFQYARMRVESQK